MKFASLDTVVDGEQNTKPMAACCNVGLRFILLQLAAYILLLLLLLLIIIIIIIIIIFKSCLSRF